MQHLEWMENLNMGKVLSLYPMCWVNNRGKIRVLSLKGSREDQSTVQQPYSQNYPSWGLKNW